MSAEVVTAVESSTAFPLFVAAKGRQIFAWHHAPPPHLRRHAAVVLCPPIGYEYMSAYRTWRLLAERIAGIGFDVLRIDYDGTGNSAGEEEEPDRVDAWLRSIFCAIGEARRLTGSNTVALVGLRAGAVLALRAAIDHGGVSRLVMWSPFSSGNTYVRELKAFARLSWQDHADEDPNVPGINAAGYLMTEDTANTFARWSIDAITTRPAPEVLIVARDDRPVDATIETHFQALGTMVSTVRPKGTAEMLVPPQLATVPERVLEEIASWFGGWHPPLAAATLRRDRAHLPAILTTESYCERAVRFGPDRRLFGILTSPPVKMESAPAVVFFNTGVEHHIGPHRLYVPLAREWAARGHSVLRFDLGGIGDSRAPHDGQENVAYSSHMLADAREAIAFVRREAPHRRIVVVGLCSGGWLAFQAARDGLPLDAIVSMNAPLYLRDGSAGRQWLTEQHELELYGDVLRDHSTCVKALRGRASYAMAARALVRQMALKVGGVFGEHGPDGLSKDLRVIAKRRIPSLFIFSEGDDGLRYFRQQVSRALRQSSVREVIRHVVVEGAGHSFRTRAAQEALRRLLSDFLASQREAIGSQIDSSDRAIVSVDRSM